MSDFPAHSEASPLQSLEAVSEPHRPERHPAAHQARRGVASRTVGRLIDVAVAGATLVVLAPLFGLIALAILDESPGPVIFRQQRLGRGRRPFTLLKFRTMVAAAEEAPHRAYVQALIRGENTAHPTAGNGPRTSLYKLTIDPRITAVGRRLRRWSLDELPQLINVLRGDMALVGPRPVIPYEAELYPGTYLARFDVKPGLTGLWQVSGRNACTYEEMIALDLEYVRRRSLRLDLVILARTVPVVLGRRGAA